MLACAVLERVRDDIPAAIGADDPSSAFIDIQTEDMGAVLVSPSRSEALFQLCRCARASQPSSVFARERRPLGLLNSNAER